MSLRRESLESQDGASRLQDFKTSRLQGIGFEFFVSNFSCKKLSVKFFIFILLLYLLSSDQTCVKHVSDNNCNLT